MSGPAFLPRGLAAVATLVLMTVLFSLPIPLLAEEPAGATESTLLTIPRGKGLPVIVRAGLAFVQVKGFDDINGTFEVMTDLRLTWTDNRLRYPASEGLNGQKEYRGAAAEAELAKIWTPNIQFVNRQGDPSASERRLRVFPNGQVETMTRTTAVFKAEVDVTRFPFDRQGLAVKIAVRESTVDEVTLDFSSEDVEFSRVAKNVEMEGWELGLVSLKRAPVAGWNGDRYASVEIVLGAQRLSFSTFATIFVPLFASLLIPFLAVWMNKVEDGAFEIDAFELANFIIGGLFAVIALSFTINSGYPAIAASDNTVTRLVGLNYLALTFALLLVIFFYRYNVVKHCFGPCVQEQAFLFLTWAFPLVTVSTGLAFLLAAAA